MNCPRCGNSLKHGSQFCSHCGFQLNNQANNGFGSNPMKPKANDAAWIVGIIAAVIAIAAIAALIFIVSAPAEQVFADSGLVAGKGTKVASAKIDTGGGTISIDEGELSGFAIDVPEDSFGESVQFDISTASIETHGFGDIFTAASPLITIDNGGTFADKPMVVTIPIDIEDDEFAMAFFYDEQTRALQPMPLLSLTNNELVTMTQHFSSIVVSKIKKKDIVTFYDTGFTPGINDFQMGNRGTFLDPKGYCAGECVAMAYYYEKKELNLGIPLYGRFDNDGNDKTPGFWRDDADAIRLCASLQKECGHIWDNPFNDELGFLKYYREKHNVNDTQTYYATLYSMMVTKQPQIISVRREGGGHIVLAYKITEDTIWVADPNNPGDTGKRISIKTNAHGAIEISEYGRYDRFGFYGMYAMMNETTTKLLWHEVINGSPKPGYLSIADYFPSDAVVEVVVDIDDNGNYITKPLTDGFVLTEETVAKLGLSNGKNLMFRVVGGQKNIKVEVYDEIAYLGETDGTFNSFQIAGGVNNIGIYYKINESFINFYRYDVIYGEINPLLAANPNPVETGDEVSFKVENSTLEANFDASAYTYRWDFGNGVEHTTNGEASNTYFYADEGTYAVSVGIYNQSGEYVGDAQTTVIVTVPEATPTPSATPMASVTVPKAVPSYLCGTWKPAYESGEMLDMETYDIWRIDQTLEIYEDGTCYYSRIFTNLYKREDETDPNAALPPYDDTFESSALDMTDVKINGQLTLYDKEYSETGSQIIGMITFDYYSGWYDSDLYLDDGKFIFLGVEYIRSK